MCLSTGLVELEKGTSATSNSLYWTLGQAAATSLMQCVVGGALLQHLLSSPYELTASSPQHALKDNMNL